MAKEVSKGPSKSSAQNPPAFWLFSLLNLLVPGVGNIIAGALMKDNGFLTRGIVMIILYLIGVVTTVILIGILILLVVYIWAIIEAVIGVVKFVNESK